MTTCEMARAAAKSLQKTWKDSAITINTKKSIIKALIFPIALYEEKRCLRNVVLAPNIVCGPDSTKDK